MNSDSVQRTATPHLVELIISIALMSLLACVDLDRGHRGAWRLRRQ